MKLFQKTLVAIFALLFLIHTGTIIVKATSAEEIWYSFTFQNNYAAKYTPAQDKTGSGSCEILTQTSGACFQAHVEAILNQTNGWGNASNGNYYTVQYGNNYYLANNVSTKGKWYSGGYWRARVACTRLQGAYTVTGLWYAH